MTYNKYKSVNDECKRIRLGYKKISSVNPQNKKPYSRISMEVHIEEALGYIDCHCGLTKDVIRVIIRLTWGFQKQTWTIKQDKLMEYLPPNTKERTLATAIGEAVARKVIIKVDDKGKESTFGFNKHYDLWIYDRELKGVYSYMDRVNNGSKPSVSGEADCITHDDLDIDNKGLDDNDMEIEPDNPKEFDVSEQKAPDDWVDREYNFRSYEIIGLEMSYGSKYKLDDYSLFLNSRGILPEVAYQTLLKIARDKKALGKKVEL
jgi:hypothetical protein